MKIDKQIIFEIHRLYDLDWSARKIARHLRISRPSVTKYLLNPDQRPAKRAQRVSKLDAYRELIKQFIEQDPQVKAPVVLQRLLQKGFEGKITIVRDYLQKLRCPQSSPPCPLSALNPLRANKCRSTGAILEAWPTATPGESSMPWRLSKATAA